MRATFPGEGVVSGFQDPETALRQAIPWLIKLRWLAIVGVSIAVGSSAHIFHLLPHWLPLYLIAGGMVGCNVVYTLLLNASIQPRFLILSQIILDLLALTALLIYAGGVVNPFAFFFVFHVIIASILLPPRESYAVAGLASGLFIGLTIGESLGVFPQQTINAAFWQLEGLGGTLPLVGIVSAFVLVIFGAAYLTVTIATRLRHRDTQVRYLLAYNQGLIDHLGEKLCVIGPDYQIHFANDLVRPSLTANAERTCHVVLWGTPRPCQDCPLEQVIDTGKVMTLTKEDDAGQVYEQVLSPLPAPQGVPAVIEKCRDITQQIALQKELVLTEKLAVVGELAAGLAHDIGNPLDGCQHALGLVRRRVPPSLKVQAFLELMEEGLQRIDLIVRRFLLMARHDGLHLQPVQVPEIIDNSLLFIEHRIAERAITVHKDWTAPLPPLCADPDTLCQALTNILLNAAEAIEGPGRIGITATHTEHHGHGRVEIQITDSGCGIPPQNLERIFEPFFTTKPDGKGTGLGLAITRRFIRSHGGDITVHSTVGQGSTFVVTLPVSTQASTEGNGKDDGQGNDSAG